MPWRHGVFSLTCEGGVPQRLRNSDSVRGIVSVFQSVVVSQGQIQYTVIEGTDEIINLRKIKYKR